jgi:hypothetical protein
MSAYYAAGGPAQQPPGLSPLTPVQVSFSGPAPQSRATVAVRLILVIACARLGSVTSASQYARMGSSSSVEQAGEQFDVAYDYLMSALRS